MKKMSRIRRWRNNKKDENGQTKNIEREKKDEKIKKMEKRK